MGSIFLVKASDEVAKLRLLLWWTGKPEARVGRALTEQCIRFRAAGGYKLDHAVDAKPPGRRARNLSARRFESIKRSRPTVSASISSARPGR